MTQSKTKKPPWWNANITKLRKEVGLTVIKQRKSMQTIGEPGTHLTTQKGEKRRKAGRTFALEWKISQQLQK